MKREHRGYEITDSVQILGFKKDMIPLYIVLLIIEKPTAHKFERVFMDLNLDLWIFLQRKLTFEGKYMSEIL